MSEVSIFNTSLDFGALVSVTSFHDGWDVSFC